MPYGEVDKLVKTYNNISLKAITWQNEEMLADASNTQQDVPTNPGS